MDDHRDLRISAVIPTYDPPPALPILVRGLLRQGVDVVVVDDGSTRPPFELPVGAKLVTNRENRGIAACLNDGVRIVRRAGASHVLTLDQDSLVDAGFVDRALSMWRDAIEEGFRPGVIGPSQVDGITYRGVPRGSFRSVPEVLQSGAVFAIEPLLATGGFDESLIIDCVDTEACLRLRMRGWDVLVGHQSLKHRLGHARQYHMLGRTVLLTRHAPFRDYYMSRNRALMLRRHWREEPLWALGMARRALVASILTLALDRPRRFKAAAIAKGYFDGVRGRSGALPPVARARWSGIGLDRRRGQGGLLSSGGSDPAGS